MGRGGQALSGKFHYFLFFLKPCLIPKTFFTLFISIMTCKSGGIHALIGIGKAASTHEFKGCVEKSPKYVKMLPIPWFQALLRVAREF